jgi:hypothetical protein
MRRSPLFQITGALLLFVLLLAGCKEKQTEETSDTASQKQTVEQAPALEPDALATVNGSAITKSELEQTLVRMVGEEVASTLEDQAKKKVLESLVLSRAISQARTKEMSADEKKHLEREVNAYREQLLTRQYIAGHGSPQPISAEEVEQYYAAHPERFGGEVIKKYEMITCKRPLGPAEKDELLQILEDSEKHNDWRQWAADLAAQGYPVAYRQGRDDEKLLHIKLTKLFASLTKKTKPQLLFIREIPYLVRLQDVEKRPLQPLEQVAPRIRKILAQQRIKKTVDKVSKEVLAKVAVKYVD